ncbi:MAG TPA: DUF892 family protein [Micromonosporaceae bacterium]|nr:DUF892 family protein [Micromonosporaceae bacterium]
MALDTPRNLFLHELGKMRDAERTGSQLLGWLSTKVRNENLAQILRTEKNESDQQRANIDACLRELGGAPLATTSDIVEGIRIGFEQVANLQPSPEVVDLFALITAMKFMHFSIGTYVVLVSWAELTGQPKCRQSLQSNLTCKGEGAGRLERVGPELRQKLLVTTTSRQPAR